MSNRRLLAVIALVVVAIVLARFGHSLPSLVILLIFYIVVAYEVYSGEIRGRMSSIRRDETPVVYWIGMGIQFFLALLGTWACMNPRR